ncbi:MAG: thioredoxin family protein [Thermoplasmatota archaeon]
MFETLLDGTDTRRRWYNRGEIMKIEIFGTGCAKCKRLEKHVRKAVKELKVKADVKKIEDITEIMNRGVMMTPALAIDGKVVFSGKRSNIDEIKEIIKNQ